MSESTAPAGNATDTSQEALKLVICCWKNFGADNKINFQAVANELEITSKAAAHKRFERLLKTFDLKPSDLTTKGSNTATAIPAASQDLSTAAAAPTPAKRKRATKAAGSATEGKTKRSKSIAVPVKENDEDPFVQQNAGKDEPEEETEE